MFWQLVTPIHRAKNDSDNKHKLCDIKTIRSRNDRDIWKHLLVVNFIPFSFQWYALVLIFMFSISLLRFFHAFSSGIPSESQTKWIQIRLNNLFDSLCCSHQFFSYVRACLLGYVLLFLAQGHNSVTPVRLKPAASWSRVKHSTTEQLRSLESFVKLISWLHK